MKSDQSDHMIEAGAVVPNIMVCVDGSSNSRDAFDACLKWKGPHDRLFIVTAPELINEFSVLRPWQHAETVNLQLMATGDKLCEAYANIAKESGVENWSVHTLVSRGSSPEQMVVNFATDNHVDTMFVGSHGSGFFRNLFAGSLSTFLVNNAPCTVFVITPNTSEEAPRCVKQKAEAIGSQETSGGSHQRLIGVTTVAGYANTGSG